MKTWRYRYFCFLLFALACKRDELPFDNEGSVVLPGTNGETARSLEEERTASLKKQEDLKKALSTLNEVVDETQTLSAEQTAELKAAQKALEEARVRNEELKKSMEDKEKEKEKEKEKDTKDVGVGTDPEPTALGPFTLAQDNICLEVQGKNIAEGAPLGMSACTKQSHQIFSFIPADDTGAYRITPQHSQKCLRVEGSSSDLGAKLIQSLCNETDLSEQFYVLGINETDFLLQSVKSQYCFNLQPSGTLTQALCDSERGTRFKVSKLAP